MSLERCLEGLVPAAKALNVRQGLPKTQGASTGPEKLLRVGHGLDTSCGLVGPSLMQEHSHSTSHDVRCDPMFAIAAIISSTLSYSQLLLAILSYNLFSASLATLLSATLSYTYSQLLDSC